MLTGDLKVTATVDEIHIHDNIPTTQWSHRRIALTYVTAWITSLQWIWYYIQYYIHFWCLWSQGTGIAVFKTVNTYICIPTKLYHGFSRSINQSDACRSDWDQNGIKWSIFFLRADQGIKMNSEQLRSMDQNIFYDTKATIICPLKTLLHAICTWPSLASSYIPSCLALSIT